MDIYRVTTVTSNVYKVFAAVMESHLMMYLKNEGIHCELQGPYRISRTMTFGIKGLCSLRKDEGSKNMACLFGCRKGV